MSDRAHSASEMTLMPKKKRTIAAIIIMPSTIIHPRNAPGCTSNGSISTLSQEVSRSEAMSF